MSVQPAPVRPALDRRSSTVPKRTSLLPKPSSIVLDASVLIAQHVQLTGTYAITISSNSILHPHCKVSSAMAPILIGEGCVIHEKAKIGLGMSAELDAESKRNSMASVRSSTTSIRDSIGRDGVVLGRYVVVESNAVVEASEIGEGTVIEVGAVIGRGCIIGKYCTISASSVVPANTRLPDYTIVFSGSERRIDRTSQMRPEILDAKMALHAKQLDMFKKLVPNNVAKWA